MDLVKWKKEFEVGVPRIDRQHKNIIKIVNNAIGLQFSMPDAKEIEGILNDLRNYIKEHFQTEEEYILSHQLPGYEEQRSEHNKFIDRLYEAQKEYDKDGRVTSINILNFIWDWFSHHILVVDKKLSKIG
jgi:hemerythrin